MFWAPKKHLDFNIQGRTHQYAVADFTSAAALEKFTSGQMPRPHLIVTSPPYPERKWTDGFTKDGKRLTREDFDILMERTILRINDIIHPGGFIVLNFDDHWVRDPLTRKMNIFSYHEHFDRVLRDLGYTLAVKIVWDKGTLRNDAKITGGQNRCVHRISQRQLNNCEHIWGYEHPGEREEIPEVDDEWLTWDTPITDSLDERKMLHKKVVWKVNPPVSSQKVAHPCVFPLELAMRMVKRFSYPGDVILDPFAGAGTTVEAAALLGRTGLGFDILGDYRPVIRAKMLNVKRRVR